MPLKVCSTSLFFIGTENVTNWTNLTILPDYSTIIITDTATTCYKMLGGSLDKDWTGLDWTRVKVNVETERAK